MATPVITACPILNSVLEVLLSSYFVIFIYNYHHFYHYYKLVHEVQIETDNKKTHTYTKINEYMKDKEFIVYIHSHSPDGETSTSLPDKCKILFLKC